MICEAAYLISAKNYREPYFVPPTKKRKIATNEFSTAAEFRSIFVLKSRAN